jgi:hypothetical protein
MPLTCTNSRQHSRWPGVEIIPNNPVLFYSGHSPELAGLAITLAKGIGISLYLPP